MHLRSATAADVDELVAFSRQSFTRAFGHLYAAEDLAAFLDEYRSPARFAAIIADPGKVLTVAEQDQRIAGYSTVEFGARFDARPDPHPRSPCILGQLYCEPGHGIGSALLHRAIDQARQRRCDAMQLSVYSENFGAQRFYQRFGFRHVADIDFWVGQHRDDEFLYELPL
ncbi:GNAT family N-acetyltransferase [Parafrankia sp. BMG5.11]|uniref:GNAT family N-acetyltransferase n=1 Tax=Parafrankia sp. BMG5.11 TaxID=222540 RepID=UPI00103BFDD1|nr:GNAT family N-acetyltransferase [Parafrankia sp. BMG5.11]